MPVKPIRMYVANRIKALRAAESMTQAELANKAGMNRSYLADIEAGNRNFGIDTLDRILSGLEASYSEFFDGH